MAAQIPRLMQASLHGQAMHWGQQRMESSPSPYFASRSDGAGWEASPRISRVGFSFGTFLPVAACPSDLDNTPVKTRHLVFPCLGYFTHTRLRKTCCLLTHEDCLTSLIGATMTQAPREMRNDLRYVLDSYPSGLREGSLPLMLSCHGVTTAEKRGLPSPLFLHCKRHPCNGKVQLLREFQSGRLGEGHTVLLDTEHKWPA